MALGELSYFSVGERPAFERAQHQKAVRETFAMEHVDLLGRRNLASKRDDEQQRQHRL